MIFGEDGREQYLEGLVLGAPPQKLRLLLIEAALQRARQAAWALSESRTAEAITAGQRCLEIVCELLAGIRPEQSEVARRTRDLYLYLLRVTNQALGHSEASAWKPVLELLEMERETWQLVCQHLAEPAEKVSSQAQPLPIPNPLPTSNNHATYWPGPSCAVQGGWEA